MHETTEILNEFKRQMIAFLDELVEQFPEQGDLVFARLYLSTQIDPCDIMAPFLLYINGNNGELRKMVKARNEAFFLEHSLLDSLDPTQRSKANHFKRIWRSGQLDDDDKDIIWSWIDTFIYLGDTYEKSKRRQALSEHTRCI